MNKIVFISLLIFIFSIRVFSQLAEYPWRPNSIPSEKLKVAVHTILTTEQRDEYVFSTKVEVFELNGRLVETLSSNANIETHSGKLFRLGGKSILIYDENRKVIEIKYFNPDGEYTHYDSYIYDAKNRLVEEIGYDTKDKILNKSTYNYLSDTDTIETTWQVFYEKTKSTPVKTLLSYNKTGRVLKRLELNSKGNDTVSFEYDSKGDFVKEIHCCKYNFSYGYKYKFDKQGNWIEREQTYSQLDKNGREETRVFMNAYRVITYYSDKESKSLK